MNALTASNVRGALAQRLAAVNDAICGSQASPSDDEGELLERAIRTIQASPDHARTWLLLTALSAQFPKPADVRWARRRLELEDVFEASIHLLTWAAQRLTPEDAQAEIEIVSDRTLVDVDFSATHDLSTGIQRVVRNLVPLWADQPIELVRWTNGRAFVALNGEETRRVTGARTPWPRRAAGRRLIPWNVPVLLLEVPFPGHGLRLAALAEHSPNPVRAIGYDCIPFVSADLVPPAEHEKFGEYIEIIKYADVVAGISQSAAAEYVGFAGALRAQGLSGPTVEVCPLPSGETVGGVSSARPGTPRNSVLCVSSLDRRKNQIAVVEAAEHLWRRGVEFDLTLIGSGGGQPRELLDLIAELTSSGRPITVLREVSDRILDSAYRDATVVVLPTLHEGYGLPITEALSYGVPVITSNYGSVRELAEGQGGLLVNPEDPYDIAAALEQVLQDPEARARLVAEAAARPIRSWADYAADLWKVFA